MKHVKAQDITPDLLVTVRGEASLEEAARLMLHMDVGSLLVVDDPGRLIGIITDADFGVRAPDGAAPDDSRVQVLGQVVAPDGLEQVYRAARRRRVSEVMSRAVVTVEEHEPVLRILELMARHRVRHIPVVRDGKPVGLVSTRDLLQLLFQDVADPPPVAS